MNREEIKREIENAKENVEIKYCPNCGRRLQTKDEKKEEVWKVMELFVRE